jgi:hypothetical protein
MIIPKKNLINGNNLKISHQKEYRKETCDLESFGSTHLTHKYSAKWYLKEVNYPLLTARPLVEHAFSFSEMVANMHWTGLNVLLSLIRSRTPYLTGA